jgi:chromosome segregation ATPase
VKHPTLPLTCIVLLGLISCATTPWGNRTSDIDSALLVDLDEEARSDIQDLRMERAELQDQVAAAAREIDARESEIDVAKKELEVAESRVEEVDARIDAARTDEDRRGLRHEDLRGARVRVAEASFEIGFRESGKKVAEAERELAERRVELADARVEHRKAKAVIELDRDDQEKVDLERYAQRVRDAKLEVRLAEIEVEAAQARAEAHAQARDAIADGGSIELKDDKRNRDDD